jgi:hypothetical protein
LVGDTRPYRRRKEPPAAIVDDDALAQWRILENHGIRITALEGLGGNLLPPLTPAEPGGEPAPLGPSLAPLTFDRHPLIAPWGAGFKADAPPHPARNRDFLEVALKMARRRDVARAA